MTSFSEARRMMVDGQVRTADVTDGRLLAAMLAVARERFVPRERAAVAYLDVDIPVSEAGRPVRRLLKPMVLAKLIQAAAIGEQDRVLDVGCATGYSTAVLARLSGEVFGLEQDEALARTATTLLADTGNASVVKGPLTAGWPDAAPYDVILVQGMVEEVPEALCGQLKEGGRLLAVVGSGPAGKAMLYRATGGRTGGRPIFDAAAPLLQDFAQRPTFVF